MLEELHWLPMHKRIEYKILMLMRNCLVGCAPSYLRELCVLVSSIPGYRFLRSAAQGDLVVPHPQPEHPQCSTEASLWSVQLSGIGYLASYDMSFLVFISIP